MGDIQDSDGVPIMRLPLHEYERILLRKCAETFGFSQHEGGSPELAVSIMPSWKWAKLVREEYADLFSEDALEDTREDLSRSWRSFLGFLQGPTDESRTSRIPGLVSENPHFPEIILSRSNGSLRIEPCESDLKYWGIFDMMLGDLTKIVHSGDLGNDHDNRADMVKESELNRRTKDVLKLEDIVASSAGAKPSPDFSLGGKSENCQSDNNDDDDDDDDNETLSELSESPASYTVVQLVHQIAVLHRRPNNEMSVRTFLSEIGFFDDYDEFDDDKFVEKKYSGDLLRAALAQFGGLLASLEMIPWAELSLIDKDERQLGEGSCSEARWRPSSGMEWEYFMFFGDDLFQYCVLNNFRFPGYLADRQIRFVVRPWEDSELPLYWSEHHRLFNDCAITRDPTGKYMILETIPGLRFRKMHRELGHTQAVEYFRAQCEQHRYGPETSLKDGLGELYDPRYEGLLRWIPFSELEVSNAPPLGAGARGTVYTAVWEQSSGVVVQETSQVDIVLKTAHSDELHSVDHILSFQNELNSAVFTQQGLAAGTIRLYGVTKSPAQVGEGSVIPSDRYMLVYELASLGPLKNYLQKTLRGVKEDWKTIHAVIIGLLEGLIAIHRAGFVHRDIHWENLLVTRRATSNERRTDSKLSILAADLGEAKRLSDLPEVVQSFAHHEFRPPEPYDVNSQAADVWTVGFLLLRMCGMHWHLTEQAELPPSRTIPENLLHVVQMCRAPNPQACPTARAVARYLDDYDQGYNRPRKEKPVIGREAWLNFVYVPFDAEQLATTWSSGLSTDGGDESDDEIVFYE